MYINRCVFLVNLEGKVNGFEDVID